MKRTVELYGRLKDGGLGACVDLELRDDATVADILLVLKGLLGKNAGLLDGAALAGEEAVLAAGDALPREGRLAVLPPVCGG